MIPRLRLLRPSRRLKALCRPIQEDGKFDVFEKLK
jgi:hypothetical protein